MTGTVTNATVMANAPGFEDAVGLAKENPGLAVGVHLNVVRGRPVLPAEEVPGIVEADGEFISLKKLFFKILTGSLNTREVYRELKAQVELVLKSGLLVTHFDSHRHFHNYPLIMGIVKRLCNEFDIRRVRVTKYCRGGGGRGLKLKPWLLNHYAGRSLREVLTDGTIRTTEHYADPFSVLGSERYREGFERFVSGLPEGTTEMGCHPGYNEGITLRGEGVYDRERDLKILLDPEISNIISREGVKLVSFADI
jgi:predicted glycoside hydrolase/deacetylase ChbG (UPF0249 family)